MPRLPKKSEHLEIRIPHATKAAFMFRCRADGASASETLRGFIEAHLAERPPAEHRRARVRLALGLAAALGVGATALPSLARPLERAGFDQLDADRSGALDRSEFAGAAQVIVRLETGSGLPAVGGSERALGSAAPEDRALHGLIVRSAFQQLDRDGDGALSFSEFRRR